MRVNKILDMKLILVVKKEKSFFTQYMLRLLSVALRLKDCLVLTCQNKCDDASA